MVIGSVQALSCNQTSLSQVQLVIFLRKLGQQKHWTEDNNDYRDHICRAVIIVTYGPLKNDLVEKGVVDKRDGMTMKITGGLKIIILIVQVLVSIKQPWA